ncbi:unnamed protein product [Lymnaea stagnalis]|uniref:AIG1-type G domain-containing protein n=1 Tax=Lymnaea stagnalis TaxID=6523 RepID=A0AAV2IKG9_LYMST
MPDTYNLLLVGRTGNGKSSTGNKILDTPVFSIHGAHDNTGNKVIQKHNKEIFGKHIQVFDGTGIGDNGEGGIGDPSLIPSIEQRVFTDQHIRLTAIILVLKFGVRFTRQEKESVEHVKFLFGDDVFRTCGVIVMTYGDNFKKEQGETFETWCESQSGDFKQLFEECGGRCRLFNNREKNTDQVEELLRLISDSDLQVYTHEDFNTIRQERLLKAFERTIHRGRETLKEVKKLHTNERKEAAKKFMEELTLTKGHLERSNIPETQKTALFNDINYLMKKTKRETHRHKKLHKFIWKRNRDRNRGRKQRTETEDGIRGTEAEDGTRGRNQRNRKKRTESERRKQRTEPEDGNRGTETEDGTRGRKQRTESEGRKQRTEPEDGNRGTETEDGTRGRKQRTESDEGEEKKRTRESRKRRKY